MTEASLGLGFGQYHISRRWFLFFIFFFIYFIKYLQTEQCRLYHMMGLALRGGLAYLISLPRKASLPGMTT
jgi:hypothetical protein